MAYSVADFAAKIKAKYPDYQGIDDSTLVKKIVEKYPDYAEQVSFEPTAQPQEDEQGIGGKILSGLGKAVETIDRFTGAPTRALLGAGLGMIDEGKTIGDVAKAPFRAIADPSTAPSGADLVKGSYGEEAYNNNWALKGLGMATDVAFDPTNLIPGAAVAKGLGAVKGAVGGTKIGQGLGAAAKSVASFPGEVVKAGMSRASGVGRPVLEEVAEMGPGGMKQIKQAAETGEDVITGGRDLGSITKYKGGESVEQAVEEAGKAGRERFVEAESKYLGESGVGQTKLGLGRNAQGARNEAHRIALNEIEKASKTTLNQTKAAPGEMRLLQDAAEVSSKVKTVEDAVKARRTIDDSIRKYTKTFEGQGQFKGTAGEKALMNIRNGFNDLVEKKILTTVKDPDEAQKFVSLFRENNKIASESIDALTDLKKGAGVSGKESDIGGKLLGINVETLQKVKNASQKAPELNGLFKEIADTTYDTIILKSIKQIEGKEVFDPNKFKALWSDLAEKKGLLFDSQKIAKTEKIIDLMTKGKALGLKGAGMNITRLKTGLGALGGLSGASVGGAEGGAAGGVTGFVLGMLGTSPAAAVASYRLVNATNKGGKKIVKGLGKFAQTPTGAKSLMIGAREMARPEDEKD